MSIENFTGVETPYVERTNHSTRLYEAAFGDIILDPTARTIVDVGSGDSGFGTDYTNAGRTVYRVDARYRDQPPTDTRNIVPVMIQEGLPFEDGTADRAVSAFMFQHLPPQDVGAALSEMLRVTTAEEGYVSVFPVFHSKAVRKLIDELRLGDRVGVGFVGDELGLANRGLHHPTLVVRNAPELRVPDETGVTVLDRLTQTLTESRALQPRPTLGKLMRKARIQLTGDTTFDTRGK